MLMCADDANLMRRIETDNDCKILQDDLNRLQSWSKTWLLEFNTSMCKVMEMGSRARRPKGQYIMKENYLLIMTRGEKDLGIDITLNPTPSGTEGSLRLGYVRKFSFSIRVVNRMI